MALTTRTSSGILAVYQGRARVGYIGGADGNYLWELTLVSEQLAGHPRGRATSRETALEEMDKMFARWLSAAGLRRKT